MRRLAALLVLLPLLAGCLSGSDGQPRGPDEATAPPVEQGAPADTPAADPDEEDTAPEEGDGATPPAALSVTLEKLDETSVRANATWANGTVAASVTWDWGDGNTSVGNPDVHAYARSGTYNITARADVGQATAVGRAQVTIDAVAGYTGFDGEPESCSKLIPDYMDTSTGLVDGYELRTIDAVILVDASFVEFHGAYWRGLIDFMTNTTDEVYRKEMQLALAVVEVIEVPRSYLDLKDTDTTGSGPDATAEGVHVLSQMRRFMDDHHPDLDRDLVYAVIGSNIAGSITGQAQCVGGARYKDASYAWGEGIDVDAGETAGPLTTQKYPAMKTMIHEMGHVLGAQHQYQECLTPYVEFDPSDYMGACTIMTNAVTVAGFQFSALNTMAIRGWAEYVDL